MKNEKVCLKCGDKHPFTLEYFSKSKSCKNGIYLVCKKCRKKYGKLYRENNKKKIFLAKKEYRRNNKKKIFLAKKEYRENNKEKIREKKRNYHLQNAKRIRLKLRRYYKQHKLERLRYQKKYHQSVENRKKIYLRIKNKLKNNLEFRILYYMRTRLRSAIRNCNGKKSDRTMNLIGCNYKKLSKYIESKFLKGMSWDNYGSKGWHIDHIVPCVSFDLKDVWQQRKCFHYTNLQPLWAKDNLVKNSFYNGKLVRKGVK